MDLFGFDITGHFMEFVKQNDFLSGGLVIGLFTGFLMQLRILMGKFRLLIVRLFSVYLTCNSSGSFNQFEKLDYWILNNFKNINSINFNTKANSVGICSTIQYKYWCVLWINKSLLDKDNISYPIFEYSIRIYGFKKLRDKIVSEIRSVEPFTFIPAIYNNGHHFDYIEAAQKPISTTCENVIKDFSNFIESKEVYNKWNLKYHRNYLLHGKPGTGKSSVIRYLAKKHKKNIYSINVDASMTNHQMLECFSERDNCIFIIEDFDRIDFEAENAWSKQTLMNILDGIYTKENSVIFATANDITKIDPALIRDGRFDVIEEIGLPTDEEIRKYIKENEIPIEPEKLFGKNLSSIQKIIKQEVMQCKGHDFHICH